MIVIIVLRLQPYSCVCVSCLLSFDAGRTVGPLAGCGGDGVECAGVVMFWVVDASERTASGGHCGESGSVAAVEVETE